MTVSAERILHGPPTAGTLEHVKEAVMLHRYVSRECGATNIYTGMATLTPGGSIPWHTHRVCEAITVLKGAATVLVENEAYRLVALECILIASGTRHSVSNDQPAGELSVHTTFADADPIRDLVDGWNPPSAKANSQNPDPKFLRRFATAEKYDLSNGALFCDFFARRFGSLGICGGYGRFLPGSSLPCHTHHYDESITIVSGEALCLVEGREYRLRTYDTAYVPVGRAHRFLNISDSPMAMIWAYAGDEPDRTLMDEGCCSGATTR